MSPVDPAHLVPMSGVECACALRYLQSCRRKLYQEMLEVEERIRAREDPDGKLAEAHRIADADVMILDGIIGRLWSLCPPHRSKPP